MVMATHFIGFKKDEFNSAVKVWGVPDFFHRVWDVRARQEVVKGDVAIFACGVFTDTPSPWTFNDSQVF